MGRTGLLKLVPVEPAPGDEEMTRERASQWSEGQRLCRRRKRHHWKPHTAIVHGDDMQRPGTLIEITERCPDCRNQRRADHVVRVSRYGNVTIHRVNETWQMLYLEVGDVPYLLEKGSQAVSEDLRDEMYAQEFMTRPGRVSYVNIEDAD